MAVSVGPSEGIQTPTVQPVIIQGICEYVVRTDRVQVGLQVCFQFHEVLESLSTRKA